MPDFSQKARNGRIEALMYRKTIKSGCAPSPIIEDDVIMTGYMPKAHAPIFMSSRKPKPETLRYV